MIVEYNRARLKDGVKQAMRGAVPSPMLATLLASAATAAGVLLLAAVGIGLAGGAGLFQARGAEAVLGVTRGAALLSLLAYPWCSLVNVGYEGWCLSMVRGELPPLGRVFCAFPQAGRVLATRILVGVFVVLWALPLGVGYSVMVVAAALLAEVSELLGGLVWLAGAAAFVLGLLWVNLRYALVDYALLDKGLSGMDAVRENRRLLQGNMGRVLGLQLSFSGWYLLEYAIFLAALIAGMVFWGVNSLMRADVMGLVEACVASLMGMFGIILAACMAVAAFNLWLTPYITGAMAKFYDWAQGAAGGPSGGPGPGGGWGEYRWSTGSNSGTGVGSGPAPRPPKPPGDAPWD